MVNTDQKAAGSLLIFLSMVLMLASLLLPRAFLSVTTFIFIALTLVHRGIGKQISHFFRTPYLWLISLLFFIPLVSGGWSSDKKEWLSLLQVKLPLLLFPIAFAGSWQLTKGQWKMLLYILIGIAFLGTLYTLFFYLQDPGAVHASYLSAKVLHVPFGDDHVRFSWMVSLVIVFCFMILGAAGKYKWRILTIFLLCWFAVFLHILSARTGLICLYVFLILFLIHTLIKEENKKNVVIGLCLLVLLPFVAWLVFPTFKNRILYLLYDASFVKEGAYLPGGTDGNRALSIRAGWHMMQQHPLGVGAGDIRSEANQWYDQHVHQMKREDRLYPSSEWLMHGAMAGWPGILLFTLIMAYPLFMKRVKHILYWRAAHIMAALGFLFDTGLGVQYGVFLYGFIFPAWWKWSQDEDISSV